LAQAADAARRRSTHLAAAYGANTAAPWRGGRRSWPQECESALRVGAGCAGLKSSACLAAAFVGTVKRLTSDGDAQQIDTASVLVSSRDAGTGAGDLGGMCSEPLAAHSLTRSPLAPHRPGLANARRPVTLCRRVPSSVGATDVCHTVPCSDHTMRRETTVPVQVSAIMLGVKDLARAKQFYGDGLGCKIDQDYPHFVSINLGEGSSSLALYEREAAAQDAGVSAEGSGFRGVSFHYIVASSAAVDEVMGNAVAAGGSVVKAAAPTQWGYFGYFSDPDGYLWKVASSS